MDGVKRSAGYRAAVGRKRMAVPYDQNGDGLIEDVWFNVVYHPLHDLDGSVGGIIAVASDVSAQVRARQTLERTNEALEEFVHVASHDLQEPLRTINVYSQILLRNLERKDESEVRTYAGFIESSVSQWMRSSAIF